MLFKILFSNRYGRENEKVIVFNRNIIKWIIWASIDHIQTYSPDYLANQAQTGMIDEVSAYYNPAGLSRLDKGK